MLIYKKMVTKSCISTTILLHRSLLPAYLDKKNMDEYLKPVFAIFSAKRIYNPASVAEHFIHKQEQLLVILLEIHVFVQSAI